MLLSELLDMPVTDVNGDRVGTVVDVRFRRGARRRDHEGDLELIALIVSPHSRLSMYGYERGRVNRPAVVARLIGWAHRGARLIPWECVRVVESDGVVLGVAVPEIPLDVRRGIPGTTGSALRESQSG
ncbi:PRC-barrel domain-containing protein [Microbacterium jejuense]|uniref:PRC-barrel domain-containing protein n=1 Tax=Microbacterium jejuense TaxID=1263637 RepID=A0ABS7HRC1_9MICO|nr:PRC-barrel domain-containing protein [Microbacterium jejuense]MBW9095507.1 PRC-barrel domain-containing protein [Microbacterium jejuense]